MRSRTAASSYSIFQAKLAPYLGGGEALAALFEAGFGEVAVFEVFDIFLDELGGVEGLGAAGLLGEAGEAAFEVPSMSEPARMTVTVSLAGVAAGVWAVAKAERASDRYANRLNLFIFLSPTAF